MNISNPIVAAIISDIGVIAGVFGQLYVANKARQIEIDIEKQADTKPRNGPGGRLGRGRTRGKPSGVDVSPVPDPGPEIERMLKRLKRLEGIRTSLIACLLLCLALLAYIVFQPGEENEWFARMHTGLTAFLAVSCAGLFVLLGLGRNPRIVWLRGVLYCIAVLFLVGLGILVFDFANWQPRSPSEKLTLAAWDGFDNKKYDLAVAASDECVDRFGKTAEALERGLASKQEPLPPVGRVPEDVRDQILQNGVLNDVATCYWIKGRAEQIRNDFGRAQKAYLSASGLVHARTWDLRGWFWSPAEDAKDRLEDLK